MAHGSRTRGSWRMPRGQPLTQSPLSTPWPSWPYPCPTDRPGAMKHQPSRMYQAIELLGHQLACSGLRPRDCHLLLFTRLGDTSLRQHFVSLQFQFNLFAFSPGSIAITAMEISHSPPGEPRAARVSQTLPPTARHSHRSPREPPWTLRRFPRDRPELSQRPPRDHLEATKNPWSATGGQTEFPKFTRDPHNNPPETMQPPSSLLLSHR